MASSGYSRWISHGIFAILNRVSVVFFGFLNVFFMVRMMPKSEIGVWVLFTGITAFLEVIRNGFIRNPFIAHLASAEQPEHKSIITSALVLHTALALVIAILLLSTGIPLSNFWSAKDLDKLFYVYAFNTIIFIPFLHFEDLQQAKIQFKGIFVSNFIRLGLLSIYIIVNYAMKANVTLLELALVQSVATVLATFVSYQYVKDLVGYNKVIDKKMVYNLVHYGKYTLGTNISSMFVKNTDSWMIARMISTAGVAVYNPALRISNFVEVPTLAVAQMVFPQVAQKLKDRGNEGVRDIYYKSVSVILAMMLPMVLPLYFFSDWIIVAVFGPDYAEAGDILKVTIFYSMIIPFNRQFGTVMDALKRPKVNFYLLVLVAVLNVIFNFIFLRQFGVIGSAYATLLSYCVVFVLNQVILARMYNVNTLKVFEGIFYWYKTGWNAALRRMKLA
ncbi:MAG: oligosaccharide flippase family protein [Bacteroidota bacterium]